MHKRFHIKSRLPDVNWRVKRPPWTFRGGVSCAQFSSYTRKRSRTHTGKRLLFAKGHLWPRVHFEVHAFIINHKRTLLRQTPDLFPILRTHENAHQGPLGFLGATLLVYIFSIASVFNKIIFLYLGGARGAQFAFNIGQWVKKSERRSEEKST